MPDPLVEQDSPLSITASVTGVLTFVVAVAAAIYLRISYLRRSEEEFVRVKASLSWFKRESTWMSELVQAVGERDTPGFGIDRDEYRQTTEYQMYSFVMDQIDKLEQRLLDIVEEVEVHSETSSRAETFLPHSWSEKIKRARSHIAAQDTWTFAPRGWRWKAKTSVAMSWLPVRTRALELVRQRDALTQRVLFAQTSMISSYVCVNTVPQQRQQLT